MHAHAGLQSGGGNVRDQRPEPINVQHLTHHRVSVCRWNRQRQVDRICDCGAKRLERSAGRQHSGGRRKDVATMECGRCFRKHGEGDELRVHRQERKQPVVRCQKVPAKSRRPEHPPLRSNTGIDDRDVNRTFGKEHPDPTQDVLSGTHIAGRHVMGDIDQCRMGSVRREHALHLRDVAVGGAEVSK